MTKDFPRRFEFARDTFAFANELFWEYQFDAAGKMDFRARVPKPDYAHRCFVLVSAARQFLYHAQFDAAQKTGGDEFYRAAIRKILSRNPRQASAPAKQIVIPGFASLREFSAARAQLLKAECGGAWRSYVLRSHWRMVFPISRGHQQATAETLRAKLKQNFSPAIHLVTFPALTINHGMILFDAAETEAEIIFSAYDPNNPSQQVEIKFNRAVRQFFLPPNRYWAGGELNIIEIFRSWLM